MRSLLCLLVIQFCARLCPAADPPATFGLTNLWTIELRLPPQEWRTIASSRTFTTADLTVNGVTYYTNVAVRQKGGGTSGGAGQGRPPLHLNFKGQAVAGVHKLSLNNNFFDTTCLRDVLSYKLCNDFGLAAPRTAFAKVYLRTSATGQRIYVGLYTATEIVDESWVRGRFGTMGGLLMKPQGGLAGGGSWDRLKSQLVPKTQATGAEEARMMAFAKLVNDGNNAAFAQGIGNYIDLDNYLRYVVLNIALANLDSYLAMGKNLYLYLNPATGKLTWIPWDFDLSFGGHFLWGTPGQRINLSIDKSSDDRLLTRLLAIPEVKDRYHALLREFMQKHFQVAAIERQIDELATLIQPAVMEERQRERSGQFKSSLGGGPGRMGGWPSTSALSSSWRAASPRWTSSWRASPRGRGHTLGRGDGGPAAQQLARTAGVHQINIKFMNAITGLFAALLLQVATLTAQVQQGVAQAPQDR